MGAVGEDGVGVGAVSEDAGAYVDEAAAGGQVSVDVYVGTVHGGYAEVVGDLGRIVARGRPVLYPGRRPVEDVGGAGALVFVGGGVEGVKAVYGAVEASALVFAAGAEVVGHALYLEGGLSEIEGHGGVLSARGRVWVRRFIISCIGLVNPL